MWDLHYESIKKLDWNFKGANTTYLVHCFHSYPARFIPQIPRVIIENFSFEGEVVLDPFCGCGTALVEALLLNRNAIGIDINPLATLISKVKTTPIEPEKLRKYQSYIVNAVTRLIMELRGQKTLISDIANVPLKVKIPPMPKRKLLSKFTEQIKKELAIIKSIIMELDDEDIKDFFLVALSSTIRTIVESKSSKVDVLKSFIEDVKIMVNRMIEFYKIVSKNSAKARIYCADARKMDFIDDESIDLIVTSPPYVNAYDYHRIHAFNIFWLEDYLVKKFKVDYETFRENELGAHSRYIHNRFYMVAEYFEGLYECFQHMNRVLKLGRVCCVVISDSTVEGEYITTNQFFKEIAKEIGFELKVDILRNIDVERKYLSKTIGKINQEHVLIFEKVKTDWERGDPKSYVRNLLKRLLEKCTNRKNKEKILEVLKEFY